ncbi:MAG: hypothetical protein OXF41_15620 [bacterium]|nr:hypothetical protein [bacterium]
MPAAADPAVQRFLHPMTLHPRPFLCLWCARFDDERETCAAYPGGIPSAIVENRWDHRQPLPDDRGLRFVPTESYPPAYLDFDRLLAAAGNPAG